MNHPNCAKQQAGSSAAALRMSALEASEKISEGIEKQKPTTKVIVVGAGISGLSVAYNLWKLSSSSPQASRKCKLEIEILEVRDRIGGRVHPISIDEANDIWIDLGGQWLHESCPENPIRRLMEDDLHIGFTDKRKKTKKQQKKSKQNRFHNRKQRNVLFDQDGIPLDRTAIQRARTIFYKSIADLEDDRDLGRLGVDLKAKGRDSISFRDLLERRTSVERVSDSRSVYASTSFDKAMNYFVHRSEENEGGRLDEVSAFLANNLYEELGGPDRVVQGSYKSLLDALSAKMELNSNLSKTDDDHDYCQVKLRPNARVEQIEYANNVDVDDTNQNRQRISISIVENEQEPSVMECDFCVCTVPLGVLQQRKIDFVPPLPQERQEAIDGIGMGLLNKIVFRFDFEDGAKFWGDLEQFGICHEDPTLIKTYYDCTNDYYDYNSTNNGATAPRSAILVQFLAGSAADRVDPPKDSSSPGLTDQQAIDESLAALRSVFGSESVPHPTVSKVTRWREDSWSCGSYSFAKVGASPKMYDQFASPLTSRLMFAGEHTSKHYHSTVHGAWDTGVREAHRIFDQLSL